MPLVLFDDHSWDNLLPLTFTRPVSDLRIGILTIAEKWEHDLAGKSSPLTREYLQGKYPCVDGHSPLFINSSVLPARELVTAIMELGPGRALGQGDTLIAVRVDEACGSFQAEKWIQKAERFPGEISLVDYPWKIFQLNGQEIEADFMRITGGRESAKLPASVQVDRPDRVFVEPGFHGGYFTLNATRGPIYLGKDSEVMEGCLIRGPFALCEGSIIKMGAKIYGPTTIGPYSKVGGEINNSVLLANSNKAHDGFLGNAVIGEWCNLGADTNNSNLKNNYANVKVWNYPSASFIDSGNQFCGLIMGDHSKCGINTMFNTGTVVGVFANIFGPGFPPSFVPSFSWGGIKGFSAYRMDKVVETANLVMERRGMQLSKEDITILDHISQYSDVFRS